MGETRFWLTLALFVIVVLVVAVVFLNWMLPVR